MITTDQAVAPRVVLRDVSWDTYQRLLHDLEDHSAPRLTYYEGTLEIMTPLLEHEGYSRFVDILLLAVEEATATPIYNAGSTTFARSDLLKGFGSDSCYYIQHGAMLRGKTRVDAQRDPPPDLVVEIDVTHSTLAKLTLYAPLDSLPSKPMTSPSSAQGAAKTVASRWFQPKKPGDRGPGCPAHRKTLGAAAGARTCSWLVPPSRTE
jgi:Uma2 family endonuclease